MGSPKLLFVVIVVVTVVVVVAVVVVVVAVVAVDIGLGRPRCARPNTWHPGRRWGVGGNGLC